MKTKSLSLTALCGTFFAMSACSTQSQNMTSDSRAMELNQTTSSTDPFLVSQVDLTKYVGEWFEIASIPKSFQSFCSKTKATYDIISDKEISVTNTCKVGFAPITIQGTARVVDEKTNAVLEVSFKNVQTKADYRIIALDKDYQNALVTNKDRSSLFVLSRTAALDSTIYNSLLDRAKAAGVDISKVKKTVQ